MSLTAPERETVITFSDLDDTAPATCATCLRPFTNGQRSGTCPSCRMRASRKRRRLAEREDPELNRPAYLSDALSLSESDKAGVEQIARTAIKDPQTGERIGTLAPANLNELLACIERNGKADGIIETAWGLPLWQFRQVEEAWRGASPRNTPQAWRRRDG